MAVIAFDPEVPVFDRFAKGFPKHAEGELAAYGPISEACSTAFAWDAHFAAYSCPSVERRLAEHTSFAWRPKMVLLVLDVDGPDHKWTPEWWEAEKVKLRAFFRDKGRGYAYCTKGGYRVILGLREELTLTEAKDALRWRFSYLDWIAAIKRDYQIECDDKCADWARCFRLPRVRRDGVDVVPLEEINRPDRILEWRDPYISLDDPRLANAGSTGYDVPTPAPVSDDQLEAAAEALVAAWPKRSRHYAGLALTGALARAGWSDGAIVDFVGYVMLKTCGDPEIDKWTKAAQSTCDKVARGEAVTGWTQLAELMTTGLNGQLDDTRKEAVDAAVLACRRSIGQGPAQDLFTLLKSDAKAQLVAATESIRADVLGAGEPADVARLERWAHFLDEAASQLLPAIAAEQKDRTPIRYGETVRSLRARGVKAPEWLVRELIPVQGMGAISAEPKISKTWVATDLAVSVASGVPALGKFAVDKPAGAFYFFAEDHESSVLTRINSVAAGKGLPVDATWQDRLIVQAAGRRLDVADDFELCVFVASVWMAGEESGVKIDLVILDPLSDVHSGEEDKRDSMKPVMTRLRAVRQVLACTVAFVHHSKKVGEGKVHRGGQRMRGSSAIHGAVDFGIYLDNPRGDRKAEFVNRCESETRAGRSAGSFDLKLTIEDDQNGHAVKAVHTWAEAEAVADNGPTDLVEQRAVTVVQKLFDQGAPLTFDQLKTKIGGKIAILQGAVELAEKEGWLSVRFQGARRAGYEITESGRELVRSGQASGGDEEGAAGTPPTGPVSGFLASVITGEN